MHKLRTKSSSSRNQIEHRNLTTTTANLFQCEQNNPCFNACVGNNGWVGIDTYANGYQSATLIMLESVLESTISTTPHSEEITFWAIDTAIYPILFSARHYIELYLKKEISKINHLKINKNIEEKLIKTHNINKLWTIFREITNETHDQRLHYFIEQAEAYISDFAQIDLTGETFRYPYNKNNSKKHLEDRSVIGLLNFYKKFKDLSNLFTDFSYLTNYLTFEYETKTYTKHLSRAAIEEIAKHLPHQSEWENTIFNEIKSNLKNKYKIGSKELSEAINIIKNHIEFKTYINPESYELQINKGKLIKFIKKQFSSFDESNFTEEEVACLSALSELGTDPINAKYLSEHYTFLYENSIKYIKTYNHQKKIDYEHNLNKVQRIEKGLIKIGYSFLLEAKTKHPYS